MTPNIVKVAKRLEVSVQDVEVICRYFGVTPDYLWEGYEYGGVNVYTSLHEYFRDWFSEDSKDMLIDKLWQLQISASPAPQAQLNFLDTSRYLVLPNRKVIEVQP